MSFTLVAVDRVAGLLGAVSASKSLAVGNSVPAIDPVAGVVASQAWTNRLLRHLILDALHQGVPASEVLEQLPHWDDRYHWRQVAVIDLNSNVGAFTGDEASPWAGHRTGADYAAIGNLLTGPEVIDEMVRAFVAYSEVPTAPGAWEDELVGGSDAGMRSFYPDGAIFARRLVRALKAGEDAGGDARGKQSAALLVASIQPVRVYPPEFLFDLRVDDNEEPVVELQRLLDARIHELDHPVAARTAPRTSVGEGPWSSADDSDLRG